MSEHAGRSDTKEVLTVINRALPNLNNFIKVVLKREKLSQEAESCRAHYEVILKTMEEGDLPPRPVSLIGDDDSGYHSTKPKGGSVPEQIPSVHQCGFLLKRDDKYRWHRYWCKVDSKSMTFYIFNDSNEETLVKCIPLATVTSLFGSQASEGDKENCFVLSSVTDVGTEGDNEDIYLAAYSDVEYQQWHSAMSMLSGTRESVRMSSISFLDGSQWGTVAPGHENASTSSSNLSSNRESMISTTSSLPYILRIPSQDSPPRGRSPLEQGVSAGDTSTLLSKQLQPLPSPPPEDGEEDDNTSVGTIYENIDNLVSQFDSTMQATVQAIGQVGQQLKSNKKHKKKDRSLLRQASFFKGNKSHSSGLSSKQRSELERGETFSGCLFKRSSSSSWKKKWCILRGAVLSYSKNIDSLEGRDYVVLDAQIRRIVDPKKSFAFTLQLRGVPEPLCFGTEDEQVMNEWIRRLESASASKGDFNWDEAKPDDHYHSQTSLDSVGISEGHYNVPRALLNPDQEPTASSQAPSAEDVNSGIYSIPRSLPAMDSSTFSVKGQSFLLSADPYAQYDVPRPISLIPDDEAIYDYPENIIDMEIYDYPPDAVSLLPPPPDICLNPTESNRNSVTSDFGSSRLSVPDMWSNLSTLPPPPSISLCSSRPSIISTTSSDEYFQSSRNSVASLEGLYDHPRSHTVGTSIGEAAEKIVPTRTTDVSESSLEFGVCLMRGYLYKKERFTWNKMDCLIRNSFLECHKPNSTQGPSLKLFLPRSIVTPDPDAKRQWAIRVKHPRREGVLQFSAEDEDSYKRWMKAFNSAAEIEVQSVNTVDEIRITDLDMQNRWATLERSTLQPPSLNEVRKGLVDEQPVVPSNRRNTYSAGDGYMSDTLKRRRKFSWIKNLSRKRGLHRAAVSVGQLQNQPNSEDHAGVLQQHSSPKSIVPQEERAHHFITEDNHNQFQGYLQVQRKGADNMWVRYWCVLEDLIISCYISKSDLTLALSIQLNGSRVADASQDSKREFSFKIWHLESGQCLFFAADDRIEYTNWFKEITKGAEYVVPLDAGISSSPLSAPFYHYTKDTSESSPSQRSSRSSIASLPEIDIDNALCSSSTGTVFHKGNLKKFSQNNKWKDRYCIIKDAALLIYATSTEKTILSTVPISGCRVELVNVPNEEVHLHIFRVSLPSGKAHMFSASSEQEMYTWAIALQDASQQHESVISSSHKEKLVVRVPANQLSSALCSGYAEALMMGSWDRYWCVVRSGCLYLYQNHESQATLHAIILKGYSITVGGPTGCKKPCVIAMQHPGLQTTFMAVLDQNELNMWFNALDKGSKERKVADLKLRNESQVAVVIREEANAKPSTVKVTELEQSVQPLQDKDTTDVLQHTTRKYEKKIRKTHRVANMTEQNLKRQQSSLTHFKEELSRLTEKLQELADKGDEHAIKRLKNVRVKLQQVEKIVPYIGKYIIVNRQAEIQTVAILKECCTVEVQRLKQNESQVAAQAHTMNNAQSCDTAVESTAIRNIDIHLETHLEEAEFGVEPPTPRVATSFSHQPVPELPQAELVPKETFITTLPCPVKDEATKETARMEQNISQQVAIEANTVKVEKTKEDTLANQESACASVTPGLTKRETSEEVQYAEVGKLFFPLPPPKSPSNYAELDFTKMQHSTPVSPRSRLNYIQVDFDQKKTKMAIADCPTCTPSPETSMDTTVVAHEHSVEENNDETVNESNISTAQFYPTKSRVSAMQNAIKIFEPSLSSTPRTSSAKPCPPPVKRKPKQQISSQSNETINQSELKSSNADVDDSKSLDMLLTQADTDMDTQSVTSGAMTVMERIKVLQKQTT